MKVTTASKINRLVDISKVPNKSTIEGNIIEGTKIKAKAEELKEKKFTRAQTLYTTDFVEKTSADTLFDNALLDMNVIEESHAIVKSSISGIKNEIKNAHDNLQIKINKLTSTVDRVALYNGVSFSNIRSIIESFVSDQDIVMPESDPLFLSILDGKAILNPSKVEVINTAKAKITINDSSNGQFETGKGISYAFDGSDLTYSSYNQSSSVGQLKLNLDLKLDSYKVVNRIVFKPNNFSTQNWIKVEDIKTSLDGISYYSIYDSNNFYRKYLFQNIEEDRDFLLSPEINSYSNDFIFDFQPTKAKHIQISLSQSNLHPATDDFKIGLNEISLHKVSFKDSGSLIVKKPINPSIVKSMALHIKSKSMIDSELLRVKYSISFDMNKWYNIQPVESNKDGAEILNFNQDWLNDSVNIKDINSNYVYMKISMEKETDPNKIKDILSNYELTASEFKPFPSISPFSVGLKNSAIENSVRVLAMPYVGVGKPGINTLSLGFTTLKENYYKVQMAFSPGISTELRIGNLKITRFFDFNEMRNNEILGYFVNEDKKLIHIYIPDDPTPKTGEHKEPWLDYSVTDYQEGLYAQENHAGAHEQQSTEYENTKNTSLKDNKEIILKIMPEIKVLSSRSFQLDHYSDGIKENIDIMRQRLDENGDIIIEELYDIIPANTSKIKLTGTPLDSHEIEIAGGYIVPFVDGVEEFIDSDEYAFSIDFENETLYLRDAYRNVNVAIRYSRRLEFKVDRSEFELGEDFRTITIRDWSFDPLANYKITYNMAVSVPNTYYTISNDGKTIQLSSTEIVNIFYGRSEFENKQLRIDYKYRENLQEILSEIIDTLSPILTETKIIYSVD